MFTYSKFTPYTINDSRKNVSPVVQTFQDTVLNTPMPEIKPMVNNFDLLNQATRRSTYHTPLPCFVSPALNTVKRGKPQTVEDQFSYQNPTGYARNLPSGAYSTKERSLLFTRPLNPRVVIKSDMIM
tara:strand:- start:757 stop:1137 length:381 start_codon:yes stop_codon:yes gene_type:complete